MPIVERERLARSSRHRHRDLTLAWMNALLAGQTDAAIDLRPTRIPSVRP